LAGPESPATLEGSVSPTLAAKPLRLEGCLPYTGKFADVAPRFQLPARFPAVFPFRPHSPEHL